MLSVAPDLDGFALEFPSIYFQNTHRRHAKHRESRASILKAPDVFFVPRKNEGSSNSKTKSKTDPRRSVERFTSPRSSSASDSTLSPATLRKLYSFLFPQEDRALYGLFTVCFAANGAALPLSVFFGGRLITAAAAKDYNAVTLCACLILTIGLIAMVTDSIGFFFCERANRRLIVRTHNSLAHSLMNQEHAFVAQWSPQQIVDKLWSVCGDMKGYGPDGLGLLITRAAQAISCGLIALLLNAKLASFLLFSVPLLFIALFLGRWLLLGPWDTRDCADTRKRVPGERERKIAWLTAFATVLPLSLGLLFATAGLWLYSALVLEAVENGCTFSDSCLQIGSGLTVFFSWGLLLLAAIQGFPLINQIRRTREALRCAVALICRESAVPAIQCAGKRINITGHCAFDKVICSGNSTRKAVDDEVLCLAELATEDTKGAANSSCPTSAIDPLSFAVNEGEFTGFVSDSSSNCCEQILDLILRLQDPLAGKVRIDCVDLRLLSLRHFREQIGYAESEPAIFPTTILNNILCGTPDHLRDGLEDNDLQRASRAAQIACAHTFITNLPAGYETAVEPAWIAGKAGIDVRDERGGRIGYFLDRGQRQMIGIARAIARDPQLLVLGKATSALDVVTERRIMESLDDYRRSHGVSVMAIMPRLQTLVLCDRIYILDDARGGNVSIAAVGDHSSLLSSNDEYRLKFAAEMGSSRRSIMTERESSEDKLEGKNADIFIRIDSPTSSESKDREGTKTPDLGSESQRADAGSKRGKESPAGSYGLRHQLLPMSPSRRASRGRARDFLLKPERRKRGSLPSYIIDTFDHTPRNNLSSKDSLPPPKSQPQTQTQTQSLSETQTQRQTQILTQIKDQTTTYGQEQTRVRHETNTGVSDYYPDEESPMTRKVSDFSTDTSAFSVEDGRPPQRAYGQPAFRDGDRKQQLGMRRASRFVSNGGVPDSKHQEPRVYSLLITLLIHHKTTVAGAAIFAIGLGCLTASYAFLSGAFLGALGSSDLPLMRLAIDSALRTMAFFSLEIILTKAVKSILQSRLTARLDTIYRLRPTPATSVVANTGVANAGVTNTGVTITGVGTMQMSKLAVSRVVDGAAICSLVGVTLVLAFSAGGFESLPVSAILLLRFVHLIYIYLPHSHSPQTELQRTQGSQPMRELATFYLKNWREISVHGLESQVVMLLDTAGSHFARPGKRLEWAEAVRNGSRSFVEHLSLAGILWWAASAYIAGTPSDFADFLSIACVTTATALTLQPLVTGGMRSSQVYEHK